MGDVERYVKIIEEEIAAGKVERFPKLDQSLTAAAQKRRERRAAREEKECESEAKKRLAEGKRVMKRPSSAGSGQNSLCDLAAKLRDRSSGLNSFADKIASMEAD